MIIMSCIFICTIGRTFHVREIVKSKREKKKFRGQDRVAVKRLHCYEKDVGLNPTAIRNEKWILGDPPHRRCPSGPTGCRCKTSDIKVTQQAV